MKVWKSLGISLLFSVVLYGVFAIVIRLHMTQLAYQFYELKAYERSLKEEQLRLRAELAETFSPAHLQLNDYQAPQPDQVVVIP